MELVKTKKSRIKTLEGLRALAFIAVIFDHTDLGKGFFNLSGYWGVSIFFALSGFVAVYSQIDFTEFNPSVSYNFKYLIKRIKKLYPLHIITTLALIVFEFVGSDKFAISNLWLRLGLNSLLLQEWFPLRQRSINVVSWFLCTIILFYFIFPWILRKIQKDFSRKKAVTHLAFCIIAEAIIAIGSYYIPQPAYSENMILEYDMVLWIVYNFPLSRILDCLIGCYLGYIFLCDKNKIIVHASLKEIFALIISIMSIVIASSVKPVTPVGCDIPVVNYSLGWSYSLVFLPGTVTIMYLFAFGQGKFSKFFSKSIFMYLARISTYCFLIHYVVFVYIERAIYYIVGNIDRANLILAQYGGWMKLTIGVLLSLIAAQIWIWITKKCTLIKH